MLKAQSLHNLTGPGNFPVPPMIVRRALAAVQPDSFNPETRTVTVVFSTGAGVTRRDAAGPYTERLSLDPAHVDLAGLQGAAVLDGHKQSGVRDILGVVERAWIEGGQGLATIRLSSRPEVADIVKDIGDGIIRSVSVGYSVARWTETTDPKAGRTKTAISWSPREISFTPVPADPGASTRDRSAEMDGITDTELTSDNPAARGEINIAIRSLATTAGLDHTFADGLIDRGATIEQARSAALDAILQRQVTIRNTRVSVGPSNDDPDVIVTRAAAALANRLDSRVQLPDESRQYRTHSLFDMARLCLELRGDRTATLSRDEIITRASMATTSDFPNLLTATGNRVLLPAYEAAASPIKQMARQGTIPDFRPKHVLRIGETTLIQPVNEAGELKAVSRSESAESYSLGTAGGIFNLSRKAIINDDLGAFATWAASMGRAAAEYEARQLVALLTQNGAAGPEMGDGVNLFDPSHGNVAASGAPISVTALGAGRQAMRLQTGLDGVTPINVTPAFLLLPPALETVADQVLSSLIYPQLVDNANPFTNKVTPLVEPRLTSALRWYLFADPAALACLEYAYLSGAQGPQLASRPGWEVLGMQYRVILDFGCGAVDWRGCYVNAGA